jgi:hypothetical protein
MRKSRNYWNKKNSFEIALKFNNKRDFKKAHIAAYELLRKNGWLDVACLHMKDISHLIKWTFEKCKEEALKYNKKIEFKNKNSWGYAIAKQNGWLDEITSHMIKYKHVTPIQWTKEKCQSEALKYNKRIDFYRNSSKAYAVCVRNGWLNDVCQHMNAPHSSQFKWTKEKCRIIALKYQYRKEFQMGDNNAYCAAKYNKWLDEICQHMTRCGDRKHKCIYSYEFSDNRVYVGLTYNINIRDKSRRYEDKDAVILHINKTGLIPNLKQLTDYVPVTEAIVLEGKYLQKYIDEGWVILNRTKTGGIGGYNSVWNFNRVKKITSKYENLKSFMSNDSYLYKIVKKEGWIYSLFPNEI